MPLLNDYGWLLFTQKVHKKIAKPHFAPSGRRTVPFVYIDGVKRIEVSGDSVLGLSGKKYFLLDTKVGKVSYFPSVLELQKRVGKPRIALISNDDYYWTVRENAYIIGGIICLLFTLTVLFVMWKVGLRLFESQIKTV